MLPVEPVSPDDEKHDRQDPEDQGQYVPGEHKADEGDEKQDNDDDNRRTHLDPGGIFGGFTIRGLLFRGLIGIFRKVIHLETPWGVYSLKRMVSNSGSNKY